ncbi:SusC/RagA family TonB-linked outer membrane protein [Saccharicrinis fermentans]|uniref:Outer membrane cobalamin receptor protein n=1 Tax=Saccharicrinis fermentans DSM 9555 = JCM 21142 TaxID=869213 RepID=W7YCI7_9BACT|nr:TonB-dependent receptor [Saccharicrinis fermentans]GAF02166.1 outer membrane cobalamin receptor protein [Saccharicrinis fermentans DSM 9555 = JCM 21142]
MKSRVMNVVKQVTKRCVVFTIGILLFFSSVLLAQDMKVGGVITDSSNGEAIPGVTVVKKGTAIGTISDIEGKYSISVSKGDVLLYSFIGMKSQEIIVSKPVQNIQLAPELIGLDEVVAIGYGSVKKKELTGAVAQIPSESIEKIVTSDLGNAIQGLVAGVNVSASSGQPGESSGILIRGITSIEGGNTPLFVVDGVPQESDPRLSTNEIETIDILKDAASCAIYGTRGAAGVILITTKQGRAGSMKIGIDASYGIQDIRSGTPLMNSSEQVYADILEMNNIYDGVSGMDDNIRLAMLRSPYYFQYNTDISDAVFIDNAVVEDYNLNLSGGTKDMSYNVTVGYFNQEGVVINSGFERLNTRINTIYKHNKWQINAAVGISLEETGYSPGGIITQAIKYHPTNQSLDFSSDDPIYAPGDHESLNVNWVLDTFKDINKKSRNKSFGNINVKYKLFNSLELNARVAVNAMNDYQKRFSPFSEVYNAEGELTSDQIRDSYVQNDAGKNRSYNANIGATYRTSFHHHNLTMYGGSSLEKYTYESFRASQDGVQNNDIQVLDGAVANPYASSLSNDYTNKLIGFIGRVQYNYKQKYLLSASVRHDGSSKFAEENTWGTFPSASVAWNLSDEHFFNGLKGTINSLKLRLSYGEVGNQSFEPYSYSAGIVSGTDYVFGGEQSYGLAQTSFANANVKWETSIQSNVGFDMALLNNKITLTVEYYKTSKEDMLMPIEVAGSNGSLPNVQMENFTDPEVILNVGDMTNQGIELALRYKAKTGKVNWTVSGTFSTNNNEVTKINGLKRFTLLDDSGLIAGKKTQSQVTAIAEGYEAGAFFLFRTGGVIKTVEQLAEYQQIDPTAEMGDLIYMDMDGDHAITDNDRQYGGSGLPEYEAGLNITAIYKGFDFSMQWYSAVGHEIMNGAKATAYAWSRHRDMTSQWSPINLNSDIPAYRGEPGTHSNYNGYTDLWLEDGSYVRLKNVTLGYSLPQRWIQKMNISKCRLYVSAKNPLTITHYEGYDPEVGGSVTNRGLDKGNYPVTSLYSVGLNLKF